MEKNIFFRSVVEVLGKPKEYIETALKEYLEKLQNDENFEIVQQEIAEAKQQEESELWVTFVELEVKTARIQDIIAFCFEYMPSALEIIQPTEMLLKNVDLAQFLNDLQARLHQVDMIAKQVRFESDHLKMNLGHLLGNYVTLLLSKKQLNSAQLSNLTGVAHDKLEDFLDTLIDKGKIDLKEGTYFLKENGIK